MEQSILKHVDTLMERYPQRSVCRDDVELTKVADVAIRVPEIETYKIQEL